MSDKKIKLGLLTTPIESAKILQGINGVSIHIIPPTMAFDSDPDTARYIEFAVTVGIPAVKHVAQWLLERSKQKGKNHTVINGHKISGDNVTIIQIINIIEGDDKNDSGKNDLN